MKDANVKTICVLTATRAEYGLLYPVICQILEDPSLELKLVVSGTHLSEKYGFTVQEIRDDKIPIDAELDILVEDECGKTNTSKTMAQALSVFSDYISKNSFDIAVILGDRYEMLAFALALVNARVPIAHLNGGERTEGALDEVYRHCITKASSVHFANCEEHRRRIIQLGEIPETVFNVGDVCVDNVRLTKTISFDELKQSLGFDNLNQKIVVVTFHPVTTGNNEDNLDEVLKALDEKSEYYYIITGANADCGGDSYNLKLREYADSRGNSFFVNSLGRIRYLSLLKYTYMVMGNSSSGIYEVPIFKIPTINIGNRQKGRLHGTSVIDCECEKKSILQAIDVAESEQFRFVCENTKNIFGDGTASKKIVNILKQKLELGIKTEKEFYDIYMESKIG